MQWSYRDEGKPGNALTTGKFHNNWLPEVLEIFGTEVKILDYSGQTSKIYIVLSYSTSIVLIGKLPTEFKITIIGRLFKILAADARLLPSWIT